MFQSKSDLLKEIKHPLKATESIVWSDNRIYIVNANMNVVQMYHVEKGLWFNKDMNKTKEVYRVVNQENYRKVLKLKSK